MSELRIVRRGHAFYLGDDENPSGTFKSGHGPFWKISEAKAALQRIQEDSLAADRARDQRATGPSPEEERRARELDEEQGIYRSFS